MEIKKRYLNEYLYDIAIKQLADEYRAKGYDVYFNEKIGNYESDLVAKQKGETVVIEVKT